MSTSDYYTPGVCNINEAEAAYRKKAFYLGLAIGIPLLTALVLFNAPPLLGTVMFIPGWMGAIGYLQSKHKFCVGYAGSGIFNSSDEYAETQQIIDEAKRKLDKARANKLNVQSIVIGITVAVLTSGILYLL